MTFKDIDEALAPLGLYVRSWQSSKISTSAEPLELTVILGTCKSRNSKSLTPKNIFKSGDYMTVLWADGTKTIVKRAADEPESDYAAFTAALGIKVFGSNSNLKRIVSTVKVQWKKKQKNKSERSYCKTPEELIEEMAKLREDEYDQRHTDEWLDGIERKQNDNRG